ncbi:HAD-IC family P-type ATPase [Amaricoccus solimangrovi]|uniref:HAD-IC family P-type ATPase n=1 Tax=Amaricoccus solimangrovi TaxID=2589815 RepID=A0A501WKH8_9RHOB|nr:HAD-IC family P-type ATPase [Amaricoccus solimangrovi]TPE49858.1 HAD-IC family P-type ATPase [Amaricoccus solimangrovi]
MAGEEWHALTGDEALARVESRASGLETSEASRRLGEVGPNALPAAAPVHPVLRFLAQFNNTLIYVLLAGALAAGLLGHVIDAGVIVVVVIINAIVGFAQEGRAEQSLRAIGSLISPRATVLRGGERLIVGVEELVPGDVVLLEAGERVPADLRLIRARGLSVDEAPLTGESVTAAKAEAPVAPDAPLGDRAGMAFSGTLVATGQGMGVVVATGPRTEIGRISRLIQDVERMVTPLLRQIDRFAILFTRVVLVAGLALFLFAVFARGFDWTEALIAVVALTVGVVPEGLPAVMTITMAIGVRRMAARRAVVRKLPAVETLGAVSVICTDKTGTLTLNEMTVRHVLVPGHDVRVGGVGYAPTGALNAENHGDDARAIAALSPILSCGMMCNDATLREEAGEWTTRGDPMEGALVALAMKAGLDPAHARGQWPRRDEIPFDAAHRYMATLHEGPDGAGMIYVKGAPEALLAMAGARGGDWEARIADLARQGERVLGFAAKRLEALPGQLTPADLAEGVEFLGLMGFLDPPRPEAVAAIARCRSAGVAVKMITGDHADTALAIGRQLGLADRIEAMTGAEVDALDDAGLARAVPGVAVFARTSPEHKLRIVRALQADGAIVAMTGDGVNDAPALKQADVGTAMGRQGTEAAREAAEMVLLDDNFASIVAAVSEGRTVYDNIRKVISWTLPTNGGEALAVIAAIFVGFALPMSPTQILWVNLVTSVGLGLVLAFEPPEPGVMTRPPRGAGAPLLSGFLIWRVVLVSALIAAATLFVFLQALGRGEATEYARTMAVNMTVVAEIFYLFNVRYLTMRSLTWRGALGTPAVLGAIAALVLAQFAFTYAPFMAAIFDTRPLRLADGAMILALGVGLMLLLEAEKLLMRRLGLFADLRS